MIPRSPLPDPPGGRSSRTSPWQRGGVAGPLLTLLLVAGLAVLAETPLHLSNPAAILLLAVAYSAFDGRVRTGLASAAIGLAYLAWLAAMDGPVAYSTADVQRLVVFAGAATLLVLFTARIRSTIDRLYLREHEARTRAEHAEQRARFLSEASRMLGLSLNYKTSLRSVARLLVTTLADWSAVYIVEDDDSINRLEVAHADPAKRDVARKLLRYDVDDGARNPIGKAVRAARSILVPHVSDETLQNIAQDDEHLRVLRQLGIRSMIFVPLVARRHTLGAIGLASAGSGRIYDEEDLRVAQTLARRAALAIDNARLYEAALASDRAKADFLSVMSHELRTPLTAIMGFTDLLLAEDVAGPISDEQRQKLERIKESGRRLLELIDRILDYTRSVRAHEPVQLETVEFFRLIREAAELVASEAKAKGLAFEVREQDRHREVVTDPTKVQRILLNLLSNAVKFTDPGGSVHVEAEAENGFVVFRVVDTGIGISPEKQRWIFEPFRQLEDATTRRAGGIGLGLNTAYRLARQLGGEVSVASEVGRGSTFSVRLPVLPGTREYAGSS